MTELTFTRLAPGHYSSDASPLGGYEIHRVGREWVAEGPAPKGSSRRPVLFRTGTLRTAKYYANAHARGDLGVIRTAAQGGAVWDVAPAGGPAEREAVAELGQTVPEPTPAGPTTRQELVKLARAAAEGDRRALATFRAVAERGGYEGRGGGWVHLEGSDRPSAQGWRVLAERVALDGATTSRVARGLPVPQEWVEQVVTLLDAGAEIRHVGSLGWIVHGSAGPFAYHRDRADAAAREAIRQGIAASVDNVLHLTDAFRAERAARRGIAVGARVRFMARGCTSPAPSGRVWEVERIESPYAKCWPAGSEDAMGAQWWPLERLVLADRHVYTESYSGMCCGAIILDADGTGTECPHPADHPIHIKREPVNLTRYTDTPTGKRWDPPRYP